MKKSIKFLAFVLIMVSVSTEIVGHNSPIKKVWQPLMELRELMKSSFHPMLKDNCVPARENAPLMLEKTRQLVTFATPPKEFSSKIKKAELQNLLVKAEDLAKKVQQNVTDDEIKVSLSEFHAAFAELIPESMKKEFQKNEGKECKH